MPQTITADELKAKIDNREAYYLIDVLSPQRYQDRHLPTAINIPMSPELPKQVAEQGLAKDAEIIVYCSSRPCGVSPAAATALEKAGYSNVVDFEDGLAGWQEAGYKFAAPQSKTLEST